jgi:outer membrane protein assembly factor BamD
MSALRPVEAARLPRRRRSRLLAGRVVLAALALGLTLAGCGAGTIPPVSSEGERLTHARTAMDKREYNVAIELLKAYIANNAGSREVDEAIYRLGLCYLRTKDNALAQVEFERLLRDYPESDSSGSASYHLGGALWGQARPPDFDQEFTQKALDQWESYLRSYPDHWLAGEARRRVADARLRLATRLTTVGMLYLKLGLPKPAQVYFQKVADEYADTARNPDARLGIALCLAKEGQRDQALERLRALEREVPGGKLHDRVVKERKRLEHKRRG